MKLVYKGDGNKSQSIPHGLGVKPDLIINIEGKSVLEDVYSAYAMIPKLNKISKAIKGN